jgi:CO/xanthine dehydrogenase Mo-binding subunit
MCDAREHAPGLKYSFMNVPYEVIGVLVAAGRPRRWHCSRSEWREYNNPPDGAWGASSVAAGQCQSGNALPHSLPARW